MTKHCAPKRWKNVRPTAKALADRPPLSRRFYAGLILTATGQTYRNNAFGDPGNQVMMLRLRDDLLTLLLATVDGTLTRFRCWRDEFALKW
jgi:phosphoribosylamine--glycine ligase